MLPHILVVGGTGMLSGVTEALTASGRVSLFARKGARFLHPGVTGYDANYYDDDGFAAVLEQAILAGGPVDLAVTWFHSQKVGGARRLAERVGRPDAPGRLFQVLGHMVVDPNHPDRLGEAARVTLGLPGCQMRQIVLGFRIPRDEGPRWLTDAEIATGVLDAIQTDRLYSIVGQVEPWSSRP